MKKKGFTLIELLAVIVILAIIALIATPLVLKYIEKSRQESKVDSAYSFVRNLETEIANYSIKNNGKKYNGTPTANGYYDLDSFKNSQIDTTVKGDAPERIKVCLSSLGQIEKGVFKYGKYYVSYDGKKGSISDKDTYDNFSCSGNVDGENITKVEVPEPEADKEIAVVLKGSLGLINNDQGLIYYNKEHFEIETIEDEMDIFDIRPSNVNLYKAPISLFKENVPTTGNIEATIRFLDGSEKTVELIKNDNYWYCKVLEPIPYFTDSENWSIYFYPNTDVEGILFDKVYSDTYHLFNTDMDQSTSHGLQSITILGTTVYFKSEIFYNLSAIDYTINDMIKFSDDYTKLNSVIVNYKDGTQDVFNATSDSIDADGNLAIQNGNSILLMENTNYYGESIYIRYKNPDFNYTDDIFKDMPEIASVTVEQDGVMKTYKMSDNPDIYYTGPGG